ncbi:conjugal transfer protein TrbA [Bacteroidales bacterium Barb6]|nr:conjugal transfer protein TrbA [Bacteroidales bacterium Barb6]
MELRIKEITKGKKVTMVMLAESVGIAQPSMSNIANGKVMPSLETLQKIATALSIPITDLFARPSNDVISCPYCGNRIKTSKE